MLYDILVEPIRLIQFINSYQLVDPTPTNYAYHAVSVALRIIDMMLVGRNALLSLFGPVSDQFAGVFPQKLGKKFILQRDSDLLVELHYLDGR